MDVVGFVVLSLSHMYRTLRNQQGGPCARGVGNNVSMFQGFLASAAHDASIEHIKGSRQEPFCTYEGRGFLLASCTDTAGTFSDNASVESMQTIIYAHSSHALPGTCQAQQSRQVTATPLTALIAVTHSSKRVYMDPSEASSILSPFLLSAIRAHPSLSSHLLQFGWSESTGWTQPVDLLSFSCFLKKFKYVRTAQLGSGSFGVVFRATDIETGEQVAIKKIAAVTNQDDFTLPCHSLREISVLRELRHPHIARLRELIGSYGSNHFYLVMDFMDCDLRHYLNTAPEASQTATIKGIMWQILQGVAYLHANGVLHRDLKPQNILVNKQTCHVKISDFGLARIFQHPAKAYTPKVVTLYYRAPELLLGVPTYGPAIDMWAVGCIMAELLNFSPIFREDSEVGLIMSVFRTLGTPTESMWPGISSVLEHDFGGPVPQWPRQDLSAVLPCLKDDPLAHDLLARLLVYDPDKRLAPDVALKHPWFDSVRQSSTLRRTAASLAATPPACMLTHAAPSPVAQMLQPPKLLNLQLKQLHTTPRVAQSHYTAQYGMRDQAANPRLGPAALQLPPFLPHLSQPFQQVDVLRQAAPVLSVQ